MKTIITFITIFLATIANNISAQDISFRYDADGNMASRYVVTLRSAVTAIKTEATGIPSVELAEQKITIFPNPTKGQIAVEITPFDAKKESSFRLFNTSGKLIRTQKITSVRTELEITGNPGIYLLDIHLGENVSKWKIIKQ